MMSFLLNIHLKNSIQVDLFLITENKTKAQNEVIDETRCVTITSLDGSRENQMGNFNGWQASCEYSCLKLHVKIWVLSFSFTHPHNNTPYKCVLKTITFAPWWLEDLTAAPYRSRPARWPPACSAWARPQGPRDR